MNLKLKEIEHQTKIPIKHEMRNLTQKKIQALIMK